MPLIGNITMLLIGYLEEYGSDEEMVTNVDILL